MSSSNEIQLIDSRTAAERERDFLPGMGKPWLMPFYDLFTRLGGVRRLQERAAQVAGIGSGQRVLDVGGGTGNLSFAVLRATPDAKVTVLDPDGYALRRAAGKAARLGVSLRLVQGYADRLPAEDAEVDHVVSSFALHHVDDASRAAFASETFRVLRPGGKITIIDFGGPGHDGSGGDHDHHSHRHGIRGLLRNRAAQTSQVAANLDNGIVSLLIEAGFDDAGEVQHLQHRFGPITIVQATR